MTLVEFFHRYWLSLSGEWSSVNIKYGPLWSSTPWYGGLWQGDQKPPKPNSSPIFYQLFFYGSCRTMYLRWIYINKKCSICKSDCMLLTGGNGTIGKLFAQQGKNQSRGSKCTTHTITWDVLGLPDLWWYFLLLQLSKPKLELNADNQCLCVDQRSDSTYNTALDLQTCVLKQQLQGYMFMREWTNYTNFWESSRFVDLRSLAVILLIILIMTKFGPKLFASIAINAVIKHGYCKHKNHLTNMSFKAYWRQNIYTLLSKHSWQNIFDKLTAMIITSNVKMIKMIFLTSMSFQ